ncbi:MAG: mechanosensitive ion channel domain-containing protein [Chloroherpetonaceae bacterium]
MFNNFINSTFGGNTVLSYLILIGVIAVSIILLKIIERTILKRIKIKAEKTQSQFDDTLITGTEKYVLPLLLIGIAYIMIIQLNMTSSIRRIIEVIAMILAAYYLIRLCSLLISYYIEIRWLRNEDPLKSNRVKAILPIINIVIWMIGIIVLLDNLGLKISAIITGLGIGGIAVAIGVQAIVKDLFGYFVILFDKPFEVGDYIAIDKMQGNISKVGIKSTRINSLDGEELIISNSDLTNSRLKNYHNMEMRRISMHIGIVYNTPFEQLKEIPVLIEEIIKNIDGSLFDRAHFSAYGEFSLIFEIVYKVIGNDYNQFMNIQQEINLKIGEEFAKRNIQFAYPTQVVHLNQIEKHA